MGGRDRKKRSRHEATGRRSLVWASVLFALLFLASLLLALRIPALRARGGPATLVIVLAGWAALWVAVRALGWDRGSRHRRRLLARTVDDLDLMDGRAFEEWVRALLEHSGIRAEQSAPGGDFGVDVLAEADGVRIAIEAKRWAGRVPNGVVRSIVAGAGHFRCDAAAVVTTSTFSAKAGEQARGAPIPVALIGREALLDLPRLVLELAAEARALSEAGR